jgi:hypothetical protein
MYIEAMNNVIKNSELVIVDESLKNMNVFTGLEALAGEKK